MPTLILVSFHVHGVTLNFQSIRVKHCPCLKKNEIKYYYVPWADLNTQSFFLNLPSGGSTGVLVYRNTPTGPEILPSLMIQ
jgi:hypothetical protein